MSDPKKHHFVPVGILEHWVPDNRNTFHCFNKRTGKVHPSTPKDIFWAMDLHTRTEWLRGNSKAVEHELGHLESEMQWRVENFVKRAEEKKFFLSPKEKDFWTHFIFTQISRHPDQRENVRRNPEWYEENMPRVRPDGTIIHPYARLHIQNPEIQKDIENEVFLSLISDPVVYGRLKPIFDSKEVFAIIINVQRKSFVIGDKGVTRWPNENSDLRDPETRLLYPVRPHILIAWGITNAANKVEIANRSQIRNINELTISQSDVIVGQNKVLVESLAQWVRKA